MWNISVEIKVGCPCFHVFHCIETSAISDRESKACERSALIKTAKLLLEFVRISESFQYKTVCGEIQRAFCKVAIRWCFREGAMQLVVATASSALEEFITLSLSWLKCFWCSSYATDIAVHGMVEWSFGWPVKGLPWLIKKIIFERAIRKVSFSVLLSKALWDFDAMCPPLPGGEYRL